MEMKNVTFAGKKGIVTGGAKGIGKAIAKQFAEMGGKAIIVDVDAKTAKETCQEIGNAEYYIIDLGNSETVSAEFQKIVDEQGKIDVLINNAGIVNIAEFDKMTLEEWNRTLAVDLTAVFLASQVLFKHMRDNGGGRIVNVASIAGKVGGGYLGTAAYAAAKAGVISLTKSIAKAGSALNIYCNSVCPAYTKTPLQDIMTRDKEVKVLEAMSLHRVAAPSEVANGVLFLASDAASFIQGENLNCDGGMLMNG